MSATTEELDPRMTRVRSVAILSLRVAVAVMAALALGVYLVVGLIHLRYPFEIEWIEGGMVDEVARLLQGKALYVKPSVDYVPFIYAPLYFYAAAASAKVFGVGFFSARLVSYLSSLGVIALIAAFVHRETKDRLAALAAAGVFAATYPLGASFYDLARVDSLFLVLLLGGLYLVRFHPTTRATAAAAALFTLAFLTKQSGPIVFAPVALHVLLADRRRGVVFVATAAALMVGSVLLWNRASDGWFWHYVYTLPSGHPRIKKVLWTFWFDDLTVRLGVSCLFSLFYLLVEEHREARRFYVLAAAGMMGAALAGRMHLGGWSNVLAPAYAILAILFGLGLRLALGRVAELSAPKASPLAIFLLAAAGIQLASLGYDPRPMLPTAAHQRAWSDLLESVRGMGGDVYVSAHGFVGPRAGKPAFAHQMALSDELRSGSDAGKELRRDIMRAVAKKRFGSMIIDNEWLPREPVEAAYALSGAIPSHDDLGPVIGWKTAQPTSLYAARP